MANKKDKPQTEVSVEVKPKFTPDRQAEFIDCLLENNWNISKACAEVGISKPTFYNKLSSDNAFKEMYDKAMQPLYVGITHSLLEGILHSDMNVRAKFIALIPEKVRAKALGETLGENEKSSSPILTL